MKTFDRQICAGLIVLFVLIGTAHSATAWGREPAKPGTPRSAVELRSAVESRRVTAMPDLVVTSASASMACAADGMRTATIVTTIKNWGRVRADFTKIPFRAIVGANGGWVHGMGLTPPTHMNPHQGWVDALEPGRSVTITFHITNISYPTYSQPLPHTQFAIVLTADPMKRIDEGVGENNNSKIIYVGQNKSDCPK